MSTRASSLKLTDEQVELLRWSASLGATTAEALALRLGVTTGSARARLASMARRRLLARVRPLTGQPSLYAPTRRGLRACDLGALTLCRVTAADASHLIVCAAVAAALERRYPDHRVLGERELRAAERDLHRPLASASLGGTYGGACGLHRPDLVLVPRARGGDIPMAVEVELSVKAPQRLRAICRSWARCRTIAGVLYVVSDRAHPAVSRAVSAARAGDRIAVLALDALIDSTA
jgi:hypothetical protein